MNTNTANAANDHDQQDLVGHGRGEHLGLRLIGEHGEQAAAHSGEKRADAEGQPLVAGQIDAHGLCRHLIIPDSLESPAVGGVD